MRADGAIDESVRGTAASGRLMMLPDRQIERGGAEPSDPRSRSRSLTNPRLRRLTPPETASGAHRPPIFSRCQPREGVVDDAAGSTKIAGTRMMSRLRCR